MADNLELNAGSGGATLAADDVGGVHYQVIKLAVGADGSADLISGSDPLPVSGAVTVSGVATSAKQDTIIGHVDGIETLLGTIDADTGNIATSTATVAGAVSGTEMQVDVVAALPAGDNNIGNVDIASAIPAGTNAIGKLAANSGVDIGDVDVTSISAGANLIGNVGIGVRTSGGATSYKNLDVDESEDEVKGTAGQVYFIHAMNLSNAKRYLKFYNDTAANVIVGTTVPVLTFLIPTMGDTNGAGFVCSLPMGFAFSAAITIAATTGFADADTGAPGANEVIVNLGYA